MSKEITDLGGIGKLLGEFRQFVMDLLRHRAESRHRELRDIELDIKNKTAALQLVQRMFLFSKKYGYSAQELEQVVILLTSTSLTPISEPKTASKVSANRLVGGMEAERFTHR